MSTCVSKDGYKEAEKIRFEATQFAAILKGAVAVAQFALSAYEAYRNFKKLWDVSERGIRLEEAQHQFIRDTYWPRELQFLVEFTKPTPWDTQIVLTRRYEGLMWAPLARGFAQKLRELEQNRQRYSTSATMNAIQSLLFARHATRANISTIASKIAFAEVEAIKDTDFERRKAAIAMRQGLIADAIRLMQSAAQGFSASANNALQAATSALGALGNAVGQYNGASAPDPFFHARTAADASQGSRSPIDSRGFSLNAGELDFAGSANSPGLHVDPSYLQSEAAAAPQINTMDGTDNQSDMLNTQNQTWTGGTVNDIQGAVQGGEPRNLARGGKMSLTFNGQTRTIDFDRVDLVAVDSYKTDMVQTGPNSLPGSPDPGVVYRSA